tara:strand:+ start:1048 stop:1830 length:783 start_codon:yes stop_codon:yes gene_type:complete
MARATVSKHNEETGHSEAKQRGKRGRPRGIATQTVYEALREEILTLIARPGQYLDEYQLEERFGVSRTPIREALIRLQSDRLVRFSANRGHFVEVINIDEIPALFEALDLYQAAVLRLAADRYSLENLKGLDDINENYLLAASDGDFRTMTEMNYQFHMLIGKISGNTFLAESYKTILNYSIRLTFLMFEKASRHPNDYENYYTRVYNEHKEMIELIRTGQKDMLEEQSKLHTQLFCSRVISFIQQREGFRTAPQDFFSQ